MTSISSVDSDFELPETPGRSNCDDNSRLDQIKNIMRDRFRELGQEVFHRIWTHACCSCQVGSVVDDKTEGKIEKAMRDTLIYSGPGISVSPMGYHDEIHEILKYLLGKVGIHDEWVQNQKIRAMLVEKDEDAIRNAQNEIRMILQNCAARINTLKPNEEAVFQAFVAHMVGLLPFTYPDEGALFTIPQKIDGKWEVCHYRVAKKFELTPQWFSSPMIAYGLTSQEGPPIMAFLGTTFPAGEGYLATILSDFTPAMSVGHAPYLLGHQQIADWLADKQKVRLFGVSLGGAMTFQVLRHHREKIGEVYAYNPPGLYPWNWSETYDEGGPQIFIYSHNNDLVSSMGFFPEGANVTVYRVYTDRTEHYRKAHVRVYSAFEKVTFLRSDPAFENKRLERRILTVAHMALGWLFIFVPIFTSYVVYCTLHKPYTWLTSSEETPPQRRPCHTL